MDQQIDYARGLIKGKIAEIIFELMFRNAEQFTVIPFGYEYTQPALAEHIDLLKEKQVMEALRNNPDFIVTSKDRKDVYFVEVKYRKSLDTQELKQIAEKIVKKWENAYLFLATPGGFFYQPCNTLIQNEGSIAELNQSHVSQEIQAKYLELLNEFEKQ